MTTTRPRLPKLALPSPRRVLRSRVLPWILLVLMTALAATSFLMWRSERAEDERARTVEAVAGRFLIALTNFSASTIDRDVSEIRSFAVGRFAEEIETTFSADRIEAIRANGSISTGRIRDLFVQEVGEDTASVFGVVSETVMNAASPAPSTSTLRVEMGLIETSDAWKVERVELLQTPDGPA